MQYLIEVCNIELERDELYTQKAALHFFQNVLVNSLKEVDKIVSKI